MTVVLPKGGNVVLSPRVGRVCVVLDSAAGPALDASALLLTASGRVRSDADFVFYNQPRSVEGAVTLAARSGRQETVTVDLARLPPEISTVVVAVSTDGQPVGAVRGLHVRVHEAPGAGATPAPGSEIVRFEVTDAGAETAFVLGELYRRSGQWKFRGVGQGWTSGLAGLATDYGITVDEPPASAKPSAPTPVPAPTPAPAPRPVPAFPVPPSSVPQPNPVSLAKAVRLEKQLAGASPAMVDLVKRAGVSLQKKGMSEHRARVALCLDISLSMSGLYDKGKVQQLCERILALAVQFDDDGSCDVFTFGRSGHDEGPLDLRNYQGWVAGLRRHRNLEGATNYAKAMQVVRRHYFPDSRGRQRSRPCPDQLPVYVMFVTDGQATDKGAARDQIAWASYEPIFWQFMAIGKTSRNVSAGATAMPKRSGLGGLVDRLLESNFSFLEELDEMAGRFLDNANFFSLADPTAIGDDQLFDLLMYEYPGWLTQARARGLVTGT
ncbi:VWA domain-containing protein [Frankia sp. Cas3]|uniref:VWA domain-containing protein n=1 Tax=Frankia sp. Cas3 TaxID=3073926 RepID=UPI002AD23B15|nr:VWA domain-containing protein [Frankia sp. Cas3]